MSAFYEEMARKALGLIKEKGRLILFRRVTGGIVNPLEGRVDGGTTIEMTLPVAILPASGGTLEAFDVRFMTSAQAGTNVRFGIVSALEPDGTPARFQPGPGDKAEFEGRTWEIMGNTPLNVDGTPVIFSIGFKGP